MTVRELRKILFHVEKQEMTVKELRDLLFNIEEQDEEITDVAMKVLTYSHKAEDK